MPTNTQLALNIRLPDGRQLWSLKTVMDFMDLDEDGVLTLVELGKLVAWNVASPGAERRDLRVWRDSVVAQKANPNARLAAPEPEAVLPQPTIQNIGGTIYRTIRGRELRRRLSCSQWLVQNLIRTGELTAVPIAVGPKQTPLILHTSAVEFLKKRCLN